MDALYEYPAQTSAGRQKFYHVPIGMGNMKDLETLDGEQAAKQNVQAARLGRARHTSAMAHSLALIPIFSRGWAVSSAARASHGNVDLDRHALGNNRERVRFSPHGATGFKIITR